MSWHILPGFALTSAYLSSDQSFSGNSYENCEKAQYLLLIALSADPGRIDSEETMDVVTNGQHIPTRKIKKRKVSAQQMLRKETTSY